MLSRRNELAHLDRIQTLSPKGERPYKAIVNPYPNTYVLEDKEGKKLMNTLNIEHFKKFLA